MSSRNAFDEQNYGGDFFLFLNEINRCRGTQKLTSTSVFRIGFRDHDQQLMLYEKDFCVFE